MQQNLRTAVQSFATELGRYRALTLPESQMLEKALERKQSPTRPWTYADDARLQTLRRRRLRAPEIAQQLDRTVWAVYTRIRDLKRKAAR